MSCEYSIRWGTSAWHATKCDQDGKHDQHSGPGLLPHQRIFWYPGDRREYTGDWPGYCGKLPGEPFLGGCTLPLGHRRRCAP